MVAQEAPRSTRRPLSPAIRAYLEAHLYVVSPASAEGQDWHVMKTNGSAYLVDLAAVTCNCPDFRKRGTERACKHIELVKLHLQADAPAPEYPAAVLPAENPFGPVVECEADDSRPSLEEELRLGLQDEARRNREWNTLWGSESEWD